MAKFGAGAVTLLLFSIAALAQNHPIDKAAADRGRKEFVEACGFCHGNDATGSRAPDLIRSALLSHDVNGETIGPVIKNGRPDKGMPAFPNANIADISAFLHSQARAALHSASVPHDYPLEKLLTGNASAGKQFFGANCASCHSPTGDLKDVAGKWSPIDLQSRFLYPRGPRPSVDVTTADGQHYEGKLVRSDEFNVTITTADGWQKSFPMATSKVKINDPMEGHRKLLYKYTDADVHNIFAYLETLK